MNNEEISNLIQHAFRLDIVKSRISGMSSTFLNSNNEKLEFLTGQLIGGAFSKAHGDEEKTTLEKDIVRGIMRELLREKVVSGVQVTSDSVTVFDENGEIVHWISDEWEDDPSLTIPIANAINIYYAEGSHVLRLYLQNQ